MTLDNDILLRLASDLEGKTAKELASELRLGGSGATLFNTLMDMKHAGRVTRTKVTRDSVLVAGWRLPRTGETPGFEERFTVLEANES